MALQGRRAHVRDRATELLRRLQNPNGSWPAFEGDDPEGCWTTSLAAITLRFLQAPTAPVEKARRWILTYKGREGHWLLKWRFRTLDVGVQFNPEKYGWPWFPGTISWVVPTALSLIALKQSPPCCPNSEIVNRIQLGTQMLLDRACPEGGWNAGNGVVFGTVLKPHVDTTAVALLALSGETTLPPTVLALHWLEEAIGNCHSTYSLSWSVLALQIHQHDAAANCFKRLNRVLGSVVSPLSTDTLCIAAIAINAAEHGANPFDVGFRK